MISSETLEQAPNFLAIPTEIDGLILRELGPEDDEAYFNAVAEDRHHLNAYGNGIGVKYQTVDDVTHVREQAKGSQLRMGIWHNGDFVGMIGAAPAEEPGEIEIGYWIRKSETKKGYGSAAAMALSEHLRGSGQYTRIFAEVHKDNQPSARLLKRIGYIATGKVQRDWGLGVIFELPLSRGV